MNIKQIDNSTWELDGERIGEGALKDYFKDLYDNNPIFREAIEYALNEARDEGYTEGYNIGLEEREDCDCQKVPLKAACNEDRGIFNMPKIEGDKVNRKYKFITSYFASKSRGGDGGPALSPEDFLKEVKEGHYYCIINEGQFQLYVGEYQKEKEGV